MLPDYGAETEPELDPVRDFGRRIRYFRPDGTWVDLTPEQAKELDMRGYPEPVEHDYLCGHTLVMFPPQGPPARCPYCRHGIDAPKS